MECFKNYTSASDYEDVMKPLFLMGRITGVAPFNVIKNKKNIRLQINYMSITCVLVCLCIYTYSVVKIVYYGEQTSGKFGDTAFILILRMYKMLFIYAFVMILYTSAVVKKQVYESIITSLKDIDITARYLGVHVNYDNLKWNHVVATFIFNAMHIVYILVTLVLCYNWNMAFNADLAITLHIPGFAVNGTLEIFVCLTNLIHKYLKIVREQLIDLSNKSSVNKIMIHVKTLEKDYKGFADKGMGKQDILERLHLIFKIYDKICSCASVINKCFSWSMLTVMGIAYATVMFNQFYTLLTCISLLQGIRDVTDIIFLIFLLFQFTVQALIIHVAIKSCSRCEAEINGIRKVLGKMLIDETDEEISAKLHQTASYLVMRFTKFSASDLFDIDSTLSFSMVGSITLYLIILIQLTIDTKNSK